MEIHKRTNRRAVLFIFSMVAFILPSNIVAAEDREISINIDVSQAVGLRAVRKTFGAKPEPLQGPPPWNVPVQINESVIFEDLTFTATWEDETKISVRLNIHRSLTRPPYHVHLKKPGLNLQRIDQEIHRRCFQTLPSDLEDAFDRMQTCKAYALHVEEQVARISEASSPDKRRPYVLP